VIILGVILLLIGYLVVTPISELLEIIGVILLVVGIVALFIPGITGGRRLF
jgi:hypothetical protein